MARSAPIGQLLINAGYLTEEQLQRALEVQKKMPQKRVGDILVELSYVTDKQVLECMANNMNIPFVDLHSYRVNPKAIKTIKASAAQRYKMVPIDFNNTQLVVATSDPLDYYSFDEISTTSGYEVTTVAATKGDINWCIDHYYSDSNVESAVADINREYTQQPEMQEEVDLDEDINGTPVVKLVNTIITQAYLKGASDIHIEPFENMMVVRIRINGDLIYHSTMNIQAHNSIVTRLKILGDMNIAERRVPQDGRFQFRQGNVNVDIRVSAMPTIHGEKIVMRLLNNDTSQDSLLDIRNLGMEPKDLQTLETMLKIPNGIIFVTGPTGSGKTTTLYAALSELVRKPINIVTVEDPVEKPLAGVNQVQVNNKAGMTFASALRSILRQDPDVIMIGEIRDGETASISVRAAITGHLVVATIHTNDAVSTIARVIDMGVEPYLAGASISGIIAQRLVKKLCPHCKEKYALDETEKALLENKVDEMYKPVGCQHCNYTGYVGRTAIYEIVQVDSEFRNIISKNLSPEELRAYQRDRGVRFLKDKIIDLAGKGETSMVELEKIIYSVD